MNVGGDGSDRWPSQLDERQCLTLLASASAGRVGVSVAALPEVHRVLYRLSGKSIVFNTHPGSPLDRAVRDAIVAFEVADPGSGPGPGWTVHVQGRARHITDPTEVAELTGLAEPSGLTGPVGPDPSTGSDTRLVRLEIDRMSGRWLAD
jgi:uncharacterized protein